MYLSDDPDFVACTVITACCLCIRTQAMVSANPGGNEQALRTLVDSMQEDFVLFTKPSGASGGGPTFLAL